MPLVAAAKESDQPQSTCRGYDGTPVRPFESVLLQNLLVPEALAAYSESIMVRPVPTLYHYTSMSGLAGILESRTVWATEFGALNDTSELTYAAR